MQRQVSSVMFGIILLVLAMACEIAECGTDAIPATRTPAPLADHSRTDRLDHDFGFKIQVPSNWTEAEWGVIVPQTLKFGWIWSPPKGLDGELHVEIAAAPTINGHVLVCAMGDLASDFSEEVLKSGVTPVDFETGQVLAEPRVRVKYFNGVEPPAPVGFEEPYTRDDKVILLACSATLAYLDPAHNGRVQFLTRIYGKYYVYAVRLITAKALAPAIASDYSRVVNSISMRCGENGSQWCGSK
jgi:hypothetical protein